MISSPRKTTILIVDDDLDSLVSLSANFEKSRFFILTARSAYTAFHYLEWMNHEIDAIISDHDIPIMSGMDFLTALRKIGFKLPFFFVTENRQLSEPQARAAGASGLFYKPVYFDRMLTSLARTLEFQDFTSS